MDAFAGRDEVRLEAAVSGGAATRKEAYPVRVGPPPMRRADGDHPLPVAGIGDAERGVAFENSIFGFEVLITAIAGCRHDGHPAVYEPFTFVADRRASTRVIANVVRDGQAQIGAVNGDIAVPLVDVANVLQGGDDCEFGVLQRLSEHPKIVEPDIPAHPCGIGRNFIPAPMMPATCVPCRLVGVGGRESVINSSTVSQLTGRLFFASLEMSIKRWKASLLSISTCA